MVIRLAEAALFNTLPKDGDSMQPRMPTAADARKLIPLASGLIDYFADALIAVATLSQVANSQHNAGSPLHWDRSKSTDHDDALLRHFVDRGTVDTDGIRHRTKIAWRALAALQEELEREEGAPVPRGARLPQTIDEHVESLLPPGSAPGED